MIPKELWRNNTSCRPK